MGKSPQQIAKLRCCASCEWIYKYKNDGEVYGGACPKCEFGSYGARFVYGDKCYMYQYTQEPWKKHKMDRHDSDLENEITKTNPIKKEVSPRFARGLFGSSHDMYEM